MVAIVLFALVFAAGLALLLARYAPNPAIERASDAALLDRDGRPRITAARLRSLIVELLAAFDLSVVEEELHGDERRLVAARRPGELGAARYVVFIEPAPAADQVEQPLILELAEYVKSERATLGMMVTPYCIVRDGLAGLEVPLELVDGPRFRHLVETYLPERLEELDSYHGFQPRPSSPEPFALSPRPALP